MTVSIIRDITDVITHLSVFSNQISESVSNQAAATEEISVLVSNVTGEIMKIGEAIKALSGDADGTYAVSEQINDTSKQTAQSIDEMGGKIRSTLKQLTEAA